MAKGSKQKYKQYSIESTEHACSVLGMLIGEVIPNIEKYEEYAKEAEELFLHHEDELIDAKVFDDINDKLLYRQREILKYVADHQNSSFSYIQLREMLVKQKYLKTKLEQKSQEVLKELLAIRNWTFHNPQSLMVAEKEVMQRNIPKEFREMITIVPRVNPVIVKKIVAYEKKYLASLLLHNQKRQEQFLEVLKCMKADYQEMFDSLEVKPLVLGQGILSGEVEYIESNEIVRFGDYASDVSQISMSIQKGKYDGSENAYNEWTIPRKSE